MKNLLLLFTTLLAVGTCLHAAPAKPNILIILADDLGYTDLGAQGCTDIPRPHIDSLAKGGMRFTDASANDSFCTATHAALMSGRYQHRSGMEDLSNVSGPLPVATCA